MIFLPLPTKNKIWLPGLLISCMKRVKNYLRNSINNDLISSLSIISIEKNEAKQLIIDDVIKAFSDGHKNRRILLK